MADANQACPFINDDPTLEIVSTTRDRVQQYASQAFTVSINQIGALNAFRIQPYSFNVSFDFDDSLFGFEMPDRPVDPTIVYNPDTTFPAAPSVSFPSISPGAAPTFDAQPLPINIPDAPSADLPDVPTLPTLAPIVIPAVPAYVLPTVPTPRPISIPADPTIDIPVFSAITPIRDFDVPAFDFSFEATPYSDALLDQVKDRLSQMLMGGMGLPLAIEQALFDRAEAREDVNDAQAITEALEDFSSRGFSEPNGILVRRMSQVRQNSRNARSAMNRDQYIFAAQTAIQNIQFAVTQGVALETVLSDLHVKMLGLTLDAAKYHAELEMRVLDAHIAILNADTALFQAQASVFRDLLQAALAKLEIFKGELEARRLISDLNQQDVQLYEAQLKAIDTLVGIFKAQVDGQTAISQNNNSIIQGYSAQVQARTETIRGLGYQFDAYKTQVEAERLKPEIFGSQVNAFTALTQAYSTRENVRIEDGRFGIARAQAVLDQWKTQISAVQEKLRADALVVTTKLDVFRALLARYQADASVEESRQQSNIRAFALQLEKEKADIDTQLKNVQLVIDQNEKIYGLISENMKTGAMVGAQLTGSALSATAATAHLQHSLSSSGSCSTSFNYSGKIPGN